MIDALLKDGITIQVIRVDLIKSEFERLHRRIDELEAKLLEKASPDIKPDKFLTARQVVAEFPISLPTLYRLGKRGELKPTGRIGMKARIYLREEIEAYLERNNQD